MPVCNICKQEPKIKRLTKCGACFKLVCENCGLRRYGTYLCGEKCAELYFFGNGEEDNG